MTQNITIASLLALISLTGLSACGQEQQTAGLDVQMRATNLGSAMAKTVSSKHEADPTTQTFLRAEGQRIDLQRGFLNLLPLALEPCAASAVFSPADLLGSTAWAHGDEHGADATIIDISQPQGTQWPLGSLAPEPGRYCGLRVRLVPVRSPDAAPDHVDMSGQALHVAPCYFQDSAEDPASTAHYCFRIGLGGTVQEVVLPLEEPLALDGSEPRTAELLVEIRYEGWFDGLPLAGYPATGTAEEKAAFKAALQANEALKDRLRENVLAGLAVRRR
jgi:hypothetical protein